MRRLSSVLTGFYKWGVPALFLVALLGIVLASNLAPHPPRVGAEVWLVWLGPLLALGIGMGVYRWRLGSVVDEVWLDGDGLRVRRGGDMARIPLADIINVDATRYGNPPRIELSLRGNGPFGSPDVAFIPAARTPFWKPFARNPIAVELIDRVDRARRGG